ncbi:hypothetical protein CPB85DRAFT_1248809 [Mucidula mucida]|nr:hypothetical protein CPB85DRAFT_1248809 [Mucidula mucida]
MASFMRDLANFYRSQDICSLCTMPEIAFQQVVLVMLNFISYTRKPDDVEPAAIKDPKVPIPGAQQELEEDVLDEGLGFGTYNINLAELEPYEAYSFAEGEWSYGQEPEDWISSPDCAPDHSYDDNGYDEVPEHVQFLDIDGNFNIHNVKDGSAPSQLEEFVPSMPLGVEESTGVVSNCPPSNLSAQPLYLNRFSPQPGARIKELKVASAQYVYEGTMGRKANQPSDLQLQKVIQHVKTIELSPIEHWWTKENEPVPINKTYHCPIHWDSKRPMNQVKWMDLMVVFWDTEHREWKIKQVDTHFQNVICQVSRYQKVVAEGSANIYAQTGLGIDSDRFTMTVTEEDNRVDACVWMLLCGHRLISYNLPPVYTKTKYVNSFHSINLTVLWTVCSEPFNQIFENWESLLCHG